MTSPPEPPPRGGADAAGGATSGAADPRVARLAWFDGVIAGSRDGSDAPQRAAREVAAAGVGSPSLELDGGRFSLLFADQPFEPRKAAPGYLDRVEAALRALAASSPNPGSVTSTVRCTEVLEDDVRETALLVRGGALHRLERTRPANADDRARALPGVEVVPWETATSLGRRRLIAIGILSALLCAFVAWYGGVIDRLAAPAAAELGREPGPFVGALVVDAEPSFGNYALKVRRGPDYPRDKAAAEALLAAATTPSLRAAASAVVDGGEIYVRVEDAEGRPLASVKVSLRALLAKEDAVVEAKLPGRIGGRRLAFSLESGR